MAATYVSYHDMLAHTEGLMDGLLENNYSAMGVSTGFYSGIEAPEVEASRRVHKR